MQPSLRPWFLPSQDREVLNAAPVSFASHNDVIGHDVSPRIRFLLLGRLGDCELIVYLCRTFLALDLGGTNLYEVIRSFKLLDYNLRAV